MYIIMQTDIDIPGAAENKFVGRLDDIGQNGLDLIYDIVEIYKNLCGFTNDLWLNF